MTDTTVDKHPVDRIPPLARLFPLGLQHVLAMYAGAVAVPLIVGGALGFTPQQLTMLINADLFVAGVASIIQSVGFWKFGVRLPLMQGCTFAAVGPMISIGLTPGGAGPTDIYGSVIACGLFMILLAPVFSQLLRFFPPLVTGTVIMIIGLSLMSVTAGWIAPNLNNGQAKIIQPGSPAIEGVSNLSLPGRPVDLAYAAGTLIVILLIERFAPKVIANLSILIGLVIGTLAAIPAGLTDWSHVSSAHWFAFVTPFEFGFPTFPLAGVISMLIVAVVIMTETTGDMVAIGEIVDKPVTPKHLANGLRADGLSTVLGGIFNTFPYTAFAQNVGW